MTLADWSELPEHIIAKIMSYLSLLERNQCSLVCKQWSDAFHHPSLWTTFVFNIDKSGEEMTYSDYSVGIKKYGHLMRNITVNVDQSHPGNRALAYDIICDLALVENKRHHTVAFRFTGNNPLFYSGAEFIDALRKFFGTEPAGGGGGTSGSLSNLTKVDLSGFTVPFDDSVIYFLAINHPNLERLNLLNQVLVNKVSPDSMYNLVCKCRKLKDLKIFYTSLSEETMLALADDDRVPLEHLGLSCRREVKFFQTISSELWGKLVAKIPTLKVTLFFDHTCPLKKVAKIMKPEIPVQILQLETFTMIHEELNQATLHYFNTLEMLVLHTRYSEELGKALGNMSHCCTKLKEMYVYCVLKKWVVDEILANLPQLQQSGRYILRWKQSPEPWVVGVEDGD